MSNNATVYTDGACSGNPGPGGWAAVVTCDGVIAWHAGREERTTNNRMELLAAIRGLSQTETGSIVVLYSDSQYLVNTMTKGWQRKVNQDLWDALDRAVAGRRVRWEWVRGHDGDHWNEEADRLARAASLDPSWGERTGFFAGPPGAAQVDSDPKGAGAQPQLSHLDEHGNARMVDVSDKPDSVRDAEAQATIHMRPETLRLIQQGGIGKGDVFTVAQVAGIMGAKKTSDLIPMCHPLPLSKVQLEFTPDPQRSCVDIRATVRTTAKTGVEMEALTAASMAALTIYDMCKAVDRTMQISGLRVTYKAGGKRGVLQQE